MCSNDLLADTDNCAGTPPPPAQAACPDIAAARGWPAYEENEACEWALEVVYDDFGNRCCPYLSLFEDPFAG